MIVMLHVGLSFLSIYMALDTVLLGRGTADWLCATLLVLGASLLVGTLGRKGHKLIYVFLYTILHDVCSTGCNSRGYLVASHCLVHDIHRVQLIAHATNRFLKTLHLPCIPE